MKAKIELFTQLFHQKNFERAVVTLSPIIYVSTLPAEIVHQYAYALRSLGRYEDAKLVYKKYLKKYKNQPFLLNGLGSIYMSTGDSLSALKYFKLAHQTLPNYFEATYNLARVFLSLHKASQAKLYFEQALRLKPTHTNSVIGLASALQQSNAPEQAINKLTALLKNQPNNVAALNNLGNAHRDRNQLEASLLYLEKAYSLSPQSPEIVKNYAACLYLNNNVTKAENIYEQHIEQFLGVADFQKEFANFRWMLNRDAPFTYIRKGIAKYPNNLNLVFMYVELLKKLDLFEEALTIVKPFTQSFPDNLDLKTTMSSIYLGIGNIELALQESKLAVSLSKKPNMNMLNQYGICLLASEQFSQAKKIYQEMIRKEPENQGWWTMYSTALRACDAHRKQYAQLINYESLVSTVQLTPMIEQQYSGDFYAEITKELDRLHVSDQFPIEQTLRNGTQTFEDLFIHDSPILSFLQDCIEQKVTDYLSKLPKRTDHTFLKHLPCGIKFNNSWSVKLKQKGFHKSHFHPEGWLSGVFYIQVPKATSLNGQGWLQFGRPEITGLNEYDYAVKPEQGLLVLFPSFYWHGTIPFESDETRLTIVVDIMPNPRQNKK